MRSKVEARRPTMPQLWEQVGITQDWGSFSGFSFVLEKLQALAKEIVQWSCTKGEAQGGWPGLTTRIVRITSKPSSRSFILKDIVGQKLRRGQVESTIKWLEREGCKDRREKKQTSLSRWVCNNSYKAHEENYSESQTQQRQLLLMR